MTIEKGLDIPYSKDIKENSRILDVRGDRCGHKRVCRKIVEIYEETGPYIVIIKNVALPYAPSDSEAKKIGLGITVLNKEVDILNQSTMKYIFTLSAVDNPQHLTAISELVTLIDKPEFFKMLDKSKDSREVIGWIKGYLNKSI